MDECSKAVFDVNWSSDGTMVAAGFEKSVVMLDMRKILSAPITGSQLDFLVNQNDGALNQPKVKKGASNPGIQSTDLARIFEGSSGQGVGGESSGLNRNPMSQNLNNKQKEEKRA